MAATITAAREDRAELTAPASVAARRNLPADYLRAFVVVLVVIHHSVLAYAQDVPLGRQFAGGPMLWRAFPVLDPQRWAGSGLIAGINDTFFMSLMFMLSGLFVWSSLRSRGQPGFLARRAVRLGAGFIFAAGLVIPLAYSTAYLQAGGAPNIAGFIRAWLSIGYWPTGPAWFVLMLLVFDVVVAGLLRLAPRWPEHAGALLGRLAAHPSRLFLAVLGVIALAYVPLAIAFGASGWTYWAIFQFQTSRPLLYFAWFAIGIALGAGTGSATLFAPKSALARGWPAWLAVTIVSFVAGFAVLLTILSTKGATQNAWIDVGAFSFALSCAAPCFLLTALFARFAQRRTALWDSLARNAYGIYLVHYAVVAWLQFVLLRTAIGGGAKAVAVSAAALAASWLIVVVLRRIPPLSRVL